MKTRFLKKLFRGIAAGLTLLFAGCVARQDIAPSTEDYEAAAMSCLNQLYEDGILDTLDDVPVMKVSCVINRTSYAFDTGWITSIIISDLNRKGKVRAMTEDDYMKEKAALERAVTCDDGVDAPPPLADLSLSGRVIESRNRVGREVRRSYMFRMELNKGDVLFGGPYLHVVKKSCTY